LATATATEAAAALSECRGGRGIDGAACLGQQRLRAAHGDGEFAGEVHHRRIIGGGIHPGLEMRAGLAGLTDPFGQCRGGDPDIERGVEQLGACAIHGGGAEDRGERHHPLGRHWG